MPLKLYPLTCSFFYETVGKIAPLINILYIKFRYFKLREEFKRKRVEKCGEEYQNLRCY